MDANIQQNCLKSNETDLFYNAPSIIKESEKVIVGTWGILPKKQETILSVKNVPLLYPGDLMLIKAKAKVGKTSHLEAIAASYLTNKIQLTWNCKLYGKTKILFIDTEQPENDFRKSVQRLWERCGYSYKGEKPSDSLLNGIIHVNVRRLYADDIIKYCQDILIKNNDIGLILIDVASDLNPDSIMNNDGIKPVMNFLSSLHSQISVIVTIHINQGDGNSTSRGHLGKELERKSSVIVKLEKITGTDENSLFGLWVEGGRSVPSDTKPLFYYEFDTAKNMFMELNSMENFIKSSNKEIYLKTFESYSLQLNRDFKTSDVVDVFINNQKGNEKTARTHLNEWEKLNLIRKESKGQWVKINDNQLEFNDKMKTNGNANGNFNGNFDE